MNNLVSSVSKFVAVAVFALSLGSCSRSDYAMLPKGGSYHGVTRVATPVPAAEKPAAPEAAVVAVAIPEVQDVATPAVAAAPTVAAVAATPVATTAPAAKALAVSTKQEAVALSSPAAAATVAAVPAPKLNLVQRLALNKVTRKVDKLMANAGTMRQHDNTASTAKTSAISGNLRTGLIFLLVGLLISLFSGISGIFGIIGAIFAVIGLVFIILWLLDQA